MLVVVKGFQDNERKRISLNLLSTTIKFKVDIFCAPELSLEVIRDFLSKK